MIPHNPLQQLHDLDRTSPQFYEQLGGFLRGNEYQNVVPSLQNEDLTRLVEYLDSVLVSISDHASVPFQESLRELRKICGVRKVLPKSCVLSGPILDTNLLPASGSVHEGTLGGSKVRIRRVSIEGGPQKFKETFHQVVVVWKHLAHPNIVPLLCVTIDPLQFISDYMPGGDLTGYITNNPEADRLSLLSDIAEGLNYLHSCDVAHKDLKGSNVLVDAVGHARITDCGLAVIIQNMDSIRSASEEHRDSIRWVAPEILDDQGTYSKEADVFSFAMVIIEVFTGAIPFSDKPSPATALAIIGGERPLRPIHPALTDGLWTLTQRCWDQDARRRPPVSQILRGLIPAWKRLINRPLVTNERISLITDIFSDPDETEAVKCLCGDDAQSFVDVIDEMLENLAPWLRRKCLSALCRICGRQALLPKSAQIRLCYDRTDTPLYRGGYADVWKGEHQGRTVAIKVLRVYSTSKLDKITRMGCRRDYPGPTFCKEAVIWKTLHHQNILPLLGVTMNNNQFAMTSEWMAGGNINSFIKAHRDANRFELLKDVIRRLIYMHGEGMIHGDLKGANIPINQHGHACLADFGLITIVSDPAYPITSSSHTNAGTIRWMSPELLYPDQFGFEDSRPTKKSDCYALGMVIFEVLSGQIPFRLSKDWVVTHKVIRGDTGFVLGNSAKKSPSHSGRTRVPGTVIDEDDCQAFTLTTIAKSTLTSHLSIQLDLDPSGPRVEYRMLLNNVLQANGGAGRLRWGDPIKDGPDRCPRWSVDAFLDDIQFGHGAGVTLTEAKEDAARQILRHLIGRMEN